MRLNNEQRRGIHSGGYVELVDSVPISRMTRLIPLMSLSPTTHLVDFACGTGPLAALVEGRIASYDGVDFSQDFIDAARRIAEHKQLANVAFHCESIDSFCERHQPIYDVVVANDFSEHVYNDDFISIFRGAYKILKDGGQLYIYTPNLDFFWEWMKKVGLAKQFPQHIAVRDAEQYRKLLVECGFPASNIEVRYLAHFNVFKYLHPLRHLPLIGKWFRAKLFIACRK